MNHITHGDLLSARADALVNTVNTEGVSGKGIALQFKLRFPENYKAYRAAAKRGEVQLGRVLPVFIGSLDGPLWIINFPTKAHWRTKSNLSEIEAGLSNLVQVVRELGIRSIAIPPLGCGNGGLDWRDVRPMIESMMAPLDDVEVQIYPPDGAPAAAAMRVTTKRPAMTMGRATILIALSRYLQFNDGATKLVAQKLAYFIQESGVPLRLTFIKAPYGPYSDQIAHVLQNMEGHFTTGYGDGSTPSPIGLLPGTVDEALGYLASRPELRDHLDRTARLIEGFESPYGLELLATVHYAARKLDPAASTSTEAAGMVQEWSKRKGMLFSEAHVQIAWDRLTMQGWL